MVSDRILKNVQEALLAKGLLSKKDSTRLAHNNGQPFDPKTHAKKNSHLLSHLGTLESGHQIYHAHKRGSENHHIYAWHPSNKTAHVTIRTTSTEDSDHPLNHHVHMLAGHEKSTVQAHEVYHHLITHHSMTLTTDEQTEGGLKVWQKLAKKPGVHIRGFHPSTGKFTKPQSLEDASKTHVDPNNANFEKASTVKKAAMLLVASKAGPPRTK